MATNLDCPITQYMICSDINCDNSLMPAWFTITGSSLELEMASPYVFKSGLFLAARTASGVLQTNAVTFQLFDANTVPSNGANSHAVEFYVDEMAEPETFVTPVSTLFSPGLTSSPTVTGYYLKMAAGDPALASDLTGDYVANFVISSNTLQFWAGNAGSFTFYLTILLDSGAFGVHIFTATYLCPATDSLSFNVVASDTWVGDSPAGVYTFVPPTNTWSQCVIQSSEVVESDGSTPHSKMSNCNSQPCTVFDLVDTIYPEVITFKIKLTYTTGQVHVSALASATKYCNNNYAITEIVT
jgi:hypothetical protein